MCSHVNVNFYLDMTVYLAIIAPMYIERVPNRNSPPAILLREGWREGKKTRKRTLANLSDWPDHKIETLRRLLRDEILVSPNELFRVERSVPHGHVEVVLGTMRKLGLDSAIAAKRCRERDLVLAMIAERLIHPCSKLATTRLWHTTTLAEELSVVDADVDELYDAMDWLLARQPRIEKKLAERHLSEGAIVLYDTTSSYYEGHTCPLARFGFDRDGAKGLPIIVYGVMTDDEGRPVAVDVYPGNTADPTTVVEQVEKLRQQFGLSRVVMVGDRGMLTEPQIEKVKTYPGLGWISALTSVSIRKLVKGGHLQLSLFDEKNLAEITSPEYPGERLVVCFNPLLAEERGRKRRELLTATEKGLERIAKEAARRTRKPLTQAELGIKAGRVLGRYRMGKHFTLTIRDGSLQWTRREDSIEQEAKLDGIYVIRTSESKQRLSAEDTVRKYKSLAQVERAFRCLKGIDLLVRPIRHRTEDHVRAHVFLCMLAYYLEWHMRKALSPILFEDDQLEEDRKKRDPIAPAKPSDSVRRKKRERVTADGLPVHSFETLLIELGTRCRNSCKVKSDRSGPTFTQVTIPNALQTRAYELLGLSQ
jgi:transposase